MILPVNAIIGVIPMRYDIGTDELVPATQEWVTQAQKDINNLGLAIQKLREIMKLHPEQIGRVQT